MSRSDQFQDIREIADAICDETASEQQIQALQKLISGNPDAAEFYRDYINMHIQLTPEVDERIEFVYRRSQLTEEFIVRPNSKQASNLNSESPQLVSQVPPDDKTQTHVKNNSGTPKKISIKKIALFAIAAVITLLILLWLNPLKQTSLITAKLIKGQLAIIDFGQIDGQDIQTGEYRAELETKLELPSGEEIHLAKNSTIKLFNNNEISLQSGKLALTEPSGNNIVVHVPNATLYTNGDALSVDLTTDKPLITTAINTTLQPKRWRPKHYWPFDGQNSLVLDSAGSAHGIPSTHVKRSQGLIGEGAYYFNNHEDARINVGSGGGTAPATGSFAVTDGVTIEALVSPEYSAIYGDVDEIFRKDQSDDELRMLLSFQNDYGKPFIQPQGDFEESLSFGLYLVGQGYHELKLPLDGQNGRPSLSELKNGKFHHIVATYQVSTGLKAIYVNGKLQASYQYPAGSKMLSGGSGLANIGNSPNLFKPDNIYYNEAFAGTLDEVAFYDFALTPSIIEHHYQQVQKGHNYFGLMPDTKPLPENIKIHLPTNSRILLDPLSGLPNSLAP